MTMRAILACLDVTALSTTGASTPSLLPQSVLLQCHMSLVDRPSSMSSIARVTRTNRTYTLCRIYTPAIQTVSSGWSLTVVVPRRLCQNFRFFSQFSPVLYLNWFGFNSTSLPFNHCETHN
ncbi:hypothetical protein EDB85DRAFT_548813 [Lactarius pseudohatsudake]|nr:hypothetical protein EDB85DRAFT_548813 [Lactarius pseudohatsudake]